MLYCNPALPSAESADQQRRQEETEPAIEKELWRSEHPQIEQR
jgi:hypothetical protein